MNTKQAREYYDKYVAGVAYVEVRNSKGDIEIGTAFHIGEGVFITARHVLDVNNVLSIGTSNNPFEVIQIEQGPFFHPDEEIDLACFKTNKDKFPAIPLGSHLDDWIDHEMLLDTTLVLGYPPIPFSKRPEIFATKAEVNAIIDKYTGGHPHFILSCMARGGFSGGLSLNENGYAMGVIVESLTKNDEPTELGYLSVISVEPIYVMLSHHKLMPESVRRIWYDKDGINLWDKEERDHGMPEDDDQPF